MLISSEIVLKTCVEWVYIQNVLSTGQFLEIQVWANSNFTISQNNIQQHTQKEQSVQKLSNFNVK